MAAASAKWNSGRLTIITATVSPLPTPRAARPAATDRTRSAYSLHVQENSSSFVRIATRSGWASAVSWNASHAVAASIPAGRSVALSAVFTSIPGEAYPSGPRPAILEPAVVEAVDVVREPDREQDHHQQEPHHAGPLHDAEGDRAPADLLHEAPEDVAAVQRQEREQVDDRQREADEGDQRQRLDGAVGERLMRDVRDPDDAVDLLALLRLEDLAEHAERAGRDMPHLAGGVTDRGGWRLPDRGRAVAEAQPGPLDGGVIDRRDREALDLAVTPDLQVDRGGRLAAVRLLAGALVVRHEPDEVRRPILLRG